MDSSQDRGVQTGANDHKLRFEVWAALHQARDTMARVREHEISGTGITATQAAILWIVKNTTNPATPAEISRWVFREPHTISTLLKQMEKKGLVTRVRDLDKKNLVRIAVTEKGEQCYRRSQEEARDIDEIISCLSYEEAARLLEYLQRLRSDALQKLGGRKLSFPFE